MKIKIIEIILIILITILSLSGCIDSRVNGTYVNEKNISLKFMDSGKVLASGKDDTGQDSANMEDYKIDNNTVIISWMGMAYILKIEDNGKVLSAMDGTNYTKVAS